MRAYIISIAAAAVISAAVSMISPGNWKKYIGIVTGLVVVMCIGKPILGLMRTNVFEGIEVKTAGLRDVGDDEFRRELKAELERRVAEDAQERLKTEFGADCAVTAVVETDESGKISCISEMNISGGNIDTAAVGRLREVYGVKKVYYGRAEKNIENRE